MKRYWIIIAIVVAVSAVALVLWTVNPGSSDQPQTSVSSSITSIASSTPPSATATPLPTTTPPATHLPVTVPTIPENEKVGTLYTRAELDAIDNTRQSFWPDGDDGKRPPINVTAHRVNKKHNAHFIGGNSAIAHFTFNCDDEQFTTDSAGEPISYTSVVLDILKHNSVKATFFVTGKFCQNYPETVQRIIDEGHILGNYGYSSIEMPALSTEEMVAQIVTLHDYVQTRFGYTMKYFRPYNGAYSQRTFALANSLGYTTLLYSAAYIDKNPVPQLNNAAALEKITFQIHNGVIFRLHPVSPNTLAILDDLIGLIRDDYYRISLYQP